MRNKNLYLSLIVCVLFLIGMLPAALATEQEEDMADTDLEEELTENPDIDEQTIEETKTMTTPPGAEMRLLQLEKAITMTVEKMAVVIADIDDINKSASLQAYLDQLNTVLEEVKAADSSSPEAVQFFVDLKKEAITLTQDFRKTALSMLKPEETDMLRKKVRERNENNKTKELTEKIKERRNKHNELKLTKLFEGFGVTNTEEMLAKFSLTNVNTTQLKEAIKNRLKEMTPVEMKERIQKIRDNRDAENINNNKTMDDIKKGLFQRKEDRIRERLDTVPANATGPRQHMLKQDLEKRLIKAGLAREQNAARIQKMTENKEVIKAAREARTAEKASDSLQREPKAVNEPSENKNAQQRGDSE